MEIEELKKLVESLGNVQVSDEEFEQAAEAVKAVTTVTDDDRLQLYGLFKQVTVGNINTTKPWAFEFVAAAKWNAWKSYENWSKEKAKLGYLFVVKKLSGNEMPSNNNNNSISPNGMGKGASQPSTLEG